MAILSVSNKSLNVWRITTGSTWPPIPQFTTQVACNSLAAVPDGFVFVRGTGLNRQIFRRVGTQEMLVHQISDGILSTVRVRNVGGENRIYYSVNFGNGKYSIYYLKDQSAVEYYTVKVQELTWPNPCPEPEEWYFYSGDFEFGSGDILYLSSGNMNQVVGIYRVSGAGADAVTGSVSRIHLMQGPIESLCFVGSDTLFFSRGAEILSINLGTKVYQVEYASPFRIGDIAREIPGHIPFYRIYLITPILWWWENVSSVLRSVAWGRDWRGQREL
jgi:hypothetical protein